MKVHIQWEDQFRHFHHLQTMNHLPTARRTAEQRARSTGKRHRLIDSDGRLLDLLNPLLARDSCYFFDLLIPSIISQLANTLRINYYGHNIILSLEYACSH